MGLRENINKNQGLVTAITGGIVVLALGIIIWQYLGGSGGGVVPPSERQQFFTNDDGKTFFKDGYTKIAPFTKDGKPVYECRVYECAGKQFVGYLIQYPASEKAKIEAAIAANNPEVEDPDILRLATMILKAPGNGDDPKNWKKTSSSEGNALVQVQCPGGGGRAIAVLP